MHEVVAVLRNEAQTLYSPFVGKVTNASYQPCSQSLYSLRTVDICLGIWHAIFEVWTRIPHIMEWKRISKDL